MARPRMIVRRGPTRDTSWFGFAPASQTIAAASTAQIDFSLNAAALALRPFTIVRTRGIIYSRSDQLAATENYGGVWGMAVVSDQATAVGVTAVPTPITDMPSDLWFALESVNGQLAILSAASGVEVGQTLHFDSKAMRKVDIGQDIVVVRETSSFQTSWATVQSFRMLVKLH